MRPSFFRAALHVGIEALGIGQVAARGEHHFRCLGGELAPGVGGAGLDDHGPALHRPGDVERPAHGEVFPLVVQHVHLAGIEIDAALHVADEGVIGQAVPKTRHHVVELARAGVALAVLHVVLEPEIQRRVGIGGGDDVPARASAADVVERGELARDVIGLVEGGRGGGDQADMLRGTGQRRQQRERIERRHGGAALQRLDRHVEHGQMIGHEEGVEAAALQRLGETLQMREVEIGVRESAGIAPGTGVDADGTHEGAEAQLP